MTLVSPPSKTKAPYASKNNNFFATSTFGRPPYFIKVAIIILVKLKKPELFTIYLI
jgi:hypothetical protein